MKKFLTAMIIILVLAPLVYFGGIWFKIGVGLISILGYKELVDLKNDKYPKIVQVIGLISLLLIILLNTGEFALVMGISYKTLSILLLGLLIPVVIINNKKYTSNDAFNLIAGILLLSTSLNLMINIRSYGLLYFLFILVITISTDTFAQFGGNLFGKHKLTKISPNKSWEGSIIGSIFALILGTLYLKLVLDSSLNIFLIMFICLGLSIISQFGDLLFSSIKRLYDKKDFSNILPGHGGILDRIDSAVFVALAISLIIAYL